VKSLGDKLQAADIVRRFLALLNAPPNLHKSGDSNGRIGNGEIAADEH